MEANGNLRGSNISASETRTASPTVDPPKGPAFDPSRGPKSTTSSRASLSYLSSGEVINAPTGPKPHIPPPNAPKEPSSASRSCRTMSPGYTPKAPRPSCPPPNAPKAPTPKMAEPRRRQHSLSRSASRPRPCRPRSRDAKRPRRESPGRRDRSRSIDRERRRDYSRSPARADSYAPPASSRPGVEDSYRPNYDGSPKKRPKLPQEKMREVFDLRHEVEMKSDVQPEPQVDVLLHNPALSYDNRSEYGFMDLDTLLASEAQKVVSESSQSEVVGIRPDRLRRLSDDMQMDMGMDDVTPASKPFVAEGSNALPVGSRASKLQASSFASPAPPPAKTGLLALRPLQRYTATPVTMPPAPLVAASSNLDPWGSGDEVVLAVSGSGAWQLQDSFESSSTMVPGPSSFGATMAPPPRLHAPAMQRPAPLTVDTRSRQEIFDDFCRQKDRIICEDTKRREANGTLPYQVSVEELAVILSRVNFKPSSVQLATVDYSAKPNESFLKHRSDERFVIKTPRLNERGLPLTTMDEETTFNKINELARDAIRRMIATKPGPERLMSRAG